jgi:hypothetical protein
LACSGNLAEGLDGLRPKAPLRVHLTNVIVIQTPDHAAQITPQLRIADLVRGEHDTSSFFTAAGGDNDPLANEEIVPVGSEVIDAPGVPEANTDHTFGR